MPPPTKFTKDEIIAAALNLVRREGFEGLTARSLGAELGVSSRPVFTAFQNMEEVQNEILKAAKAAYNSYSDKGLAQEYPFKGIGMQYFNFAKEEPKLFEILFMKRNVSDAGVLDALFTAHDNYERILKAIQEGYGLYEDESVKTFQTMWLFTHGIACLHVTGMIPFTDDEVEKRITEVLYGTLLKLKGERPKGEKD
jgi:AcrR family transcriptional regulator